LKLGLQSEKTLTPIDQRAGQWQVYVSSFYFLNDLIFLTRIFQFGLILEIESRFGIVANIHGHLIPNGACHVHDDFFIEGEGRNASESFADVGIILLGEVKPENQFCTSRGGDINGI